MNSPQPLEPHLRQTRQATEYVVYPPRRAVRIEDGDWDRWIRSISRVPKPNPLFRDTAFACFGIAVPTLVSAIAAWATPSQVPSWVGFVYLAVGMLALAIGVLSLKYNSALQSINAASLGAILEDMRDVRERSVRSEETYEAPQTPVIR